LADFSSLAPDFQLTDTHGYPVDLSMFRDRANVILVFIRGLSCPFCRQQLARLRRDEPAFEARRTVLLVIAPDRPDQLRDYWKRENFPFAGFADSDHRVASLYGQQADAYRKGRLPVVVIIDRGGQIRFRCDSSSPADFPTNPALLNELDRINREHASQ
jgi:peroxiredoxin